MGQPRKKKDGTVEFISTRPGRIDKAIELGYMADGDKLKLARRIFFDNEAGYRQISRLLELEPNRKEHVQSRNVAPDRAGPALAVGTSGIRARVGARNCIRAPGGREEMVEAKAPDHFGLSRAANRLDKSQYETSHRTSREVGTATGPASRPAVSRCRRGWRGPSPSASRGAVMRTNFPWGAGSQLDALSSPGDLFCR